MAIALTGTRTNVRTLRLAQPAVRPRSSFDLSAVAVLALAASGIWLFVLPLELLRLVAT